MLLTLKRIVQEVAQIPELGLALDCLSQRLKDAMQADCCSVYLADYQQQHFTLMATEGLAKTAVGDVCIGFSEGLIGLIGQREEPINIEDAHQHPRFKYYPEVQEENFSRLFRYAYYSPAQSVGGDNGPAKKQAKVQRRRRSFFSDAGCSGSTRD